MKNNKNETLVAILSIVIYVMANSYSMQNFGMTSIKSVILNAVLVLTLTFYILKNKLGKYYGLTTFPKLKPFLYFIPLLLIASVNLWNGININHSINEIIYYSITMLFVGYLEEVIFRGLLFKMMAKDNVKSAIIVSSLTFGLGHVINLLNGAELVSTLAQMLYAISIGYVFVIIFQKGKSLWPCIIAHVIINALSIYNIGNDLSIYIIPAFIIVVSISYAIYLKATIKEA